MRANFKNMLEHFFEKIPNDENTNVVLRVALLFIVIPFIPASNLLFSVGFVVAERVLYFPSIGVCILIAYGVESLHHTISIKLEGKYYFKNVCKLCIRVSICCLLVSFGFRTWQRNFVWESRMTLFTSGIRDNPQNAKMHYNYANLKKSLGQSAEAIEHYSIAIKLWPDYASAHNNLGTLLMDNPVAAKHHFLKAITSGNQAHGGAHFNLRILHMWGKRYLEAVFHFNKSLLIDPSHSKAVEYLSICFNKMNHLKEKNMGNGV